ncbi:MAG: cyclophilin family peptidyl-prolyl cis-trans isomerase [Rhodothermales bacterium]|jgi:cyclophilin family peptidyl-prolyl cis-trans isomerase
MFRNLTTFLLLTLFLVGCGPKVEPSTDLFDIETQLGTITVRLYENTPLHAENFRKLVSENFYDGTLLHRVIPRFMVQGGDPNSKDGNPMNNGIGGPGYTVPAELRPEYFHKRGALAAARRPNNPEKASSGSQFYLVSGRAYADAELDQIEEHYSNQSGQPFKFPAEHREIYTTVGGAPLLDTQYTVYGEIVEGLEVLDAISRVSTPNTRGDATTPVLGDQPNDPLPMVIRPANR